MDIGSCCWFVTQAEEKRESDILFVHVKYLALWSKTTQLRRHMAGAVMLLTCLSACATPGGSGSLTQRTATLTRGSLIASISASGNIQSEEETRLGFQSGGLVTAVQVKVGDGVLVGTVLAQLDTTEATLTLRKSMAALKDAEATVVIATANYSRTLDGIRPADVAAARAAVNAAQATYNKVAAGPTDEEQRAARARLANAEAELKQAQFAYDNAYRQDPAGISASPAALQLEQATNKFNEAKAQYDQALRPASAADTANAQRQIADAKAQLANAGRAVRQYDIEKAKAEITQAQNRVVQALLDMDQAQYRIDQARIIAPFNGVVSNVDVKAGEPVAGGAQTVITLIDTSQLHININVDEVDIARVKIGQAVDVTLDSLPGEALSGQVVRISPASRTVNGVVVYNVRVALPAMQAPLRPGMTANARITLDKRENAVLAPSWAIRKDRKTGKSYLTVPDGKPEENRVAEVEVIVGLRDDAMVEVISGANEGEVVVQPVLSSETN